MANRSRTLALVVAAILAACSESDDGPAAPELSPARIVLSQATVALTAHRLDESSDTVTIEITNGGEAQLNGLQVAVDYSGSPGAGWLEVSVDRATAPAQLRVVTRTRELEGGAYQARIRISSAAATADAAIDVRLDLLPPLTADLRFVGEILPVDILLKAGEAMEVRDIQIDNVGSLPAEFEVWWRRASELGVLSIADPVIRVGSRHSLEPGASLTLDGSAVLASRGPLGRHYLVLQIIPFGDYHAERDARWIPYVVEGLAVDVAVQGEGSVSVTPEAAEYEYQAEISLAADPAPGWVFDRWEPASGEDGPSQDNPLVRVLEQDASYTAVFLRNPHPDLRFGVEPGLQSTVFQPAQDLGLTEFTVENTGSQHVRVDVGIFLSTDAAIDVPAQGGGEGDRLLHSFQLDVFAGETRTIAHAGTPLPYSIAPGEWYVGVVLDWGDDAVEWDESNNEVVLPFTVEGFRGEVVIEGSGQVTVDPGLENLRMGEWVSFTAVPDEGWAFREWWSTQAGRSERIPWGFDVDEDFQVTATFVLLVASPSLTAQLSEGGRLDLIWSFDWPCTRGRVCTPSTDDAYELQIEDLSGSAGFQPLLHASETRDSPFTHSYRPPAGSYRFRVRALGADFQSEWSEAVTVIVP